MKRKQREGREKNRGEGKGELLKNEHERNMRRKGVINEGEKRKRRAIRGMKGKQVEGMEEKWESLKNEKM